VETCDVHTHSGGYCQKHYAIKKQYNLDPEEYETMLTAQVGVCAICKKDCSTGRRLAVDHDHASDEVRGLLCSNCNTSLGGFKDSEELLLSAIAYLNASKSGV
jgi:hypothetical protein